MIGVTVGTYVKATTGRWTFGEEAVAIYIDQNRQMFDYFCGLFYTSSDMIMETSRCFVSIHQDQKWTFLCCLYSENF